jgi:methionyl-tRNA formyltransferase
MNIVFMGSSEFGIPTLEKLMERHHICGVVSTPARPKGRGQKFLESPIAAYARSRNVEKIFTPPDLKSSDLFSGLSECRADVFVVVAFRILPGVLFSIPRLGTINIHASLLPALRGPAPIQRAIEAGEKQTGVTIFKIDEGVDTGGVLLQKKIEIGAEETTPGLSARLSHLGADALLETLDGLSQGTLVPVPQNAAYASRAPKLLKTEALLDWLQPAEALFNKIRAFKPFPGTCTFLEGKRLGIMWARSFGDEPSTAPGRISLVTDTFFEVECGKGRLRVLEVTPEGRRSMSVHDFLLGTKIREGTYLTWMPAN